jgi:hypothetical protein
VLVARIACQFVIPIQRPDMAATAKLWQTVVWLTSIVVESTATALTGQNEQYLDGLIGFISTATVGEETEPRLARERRGRGKIATNSTCRPAHDSFCTGRVIYLSWSPNLPLLLLLAAVKQGCLTHIVR